MQATDLRYIENLSTLKFQTIPRSRMDHGKMNCFSSKDVKQYFMKPQYSNLFMKQVIANIQMNGHICPCPVGIGLTMK